MIDLLVVRVVTVWTQGTVCLLQDLSVERVNARVPFSNSVLWKGDEEGKPVWGLMVLGCHKFDNCGCIDEQASCLLTKGIDIVCERPLFCDISVPGS